MGEATPHPGPRPGDNLLANPGIRGVEDSDVGSAGRAKNKKQFLTQWSQSTRRLVSLTSTGTKKDTSTLSQSSDRNLNKSQPKSAFKNIGANRKSLFKYRSSRELDFGESSSSPISSNVALSPEKKRLYATIPWMGMNDSALETLLHKHFQPKGFQVVMQFKVFKRRQGTMVYGSTNFNSSTEKPQLFVVSKNESHDLLVHRVNVKGDSDQLTFQSTKPIRLQDLDTIDGDGSNSITMSKFNHLRNSINFPFALVFKEDQSTYTYCASTLDDLDRKALLWCLLQLCLQYLHRLPELKYLNRSELALLNSRYKFDFRCTLLKDITMSRSTDAHGTSQNRSDDESSSDNEEGTNNRTTNHPASKDAEKCLESKSILTRTEQSELSAILVNEHLDTINPSDLSRMLREKMEKLETETEEELRGWEDRDVNGPSYKNNYAAKAEGKQKPTKFEDPIETLVEKLEIVEGELSMLDAWLSNYNAELRGMRKGIHKIEQENNRLQLKSRNQDRLRKTLKCLIERYSISENASKALIIMPTVLMETVRQVENVPGEDQPGLSKLCELAVELQLALAGNNKCSTGTYSSSNHDGLNVDGNDGVGLGGEDESVRAVVNEESMRAVVERIERIQYDFDTFCSHVNFCLVDRFRKLSTRALEDYKWKDVNQAKTNLPIIEDVAADLHTKLRQYKPLIDHVLKMAPGTHEEIRKSYIDDMTSLYKVVLKGYFTALTDGMELSNDFDSRLSAMPDTVIDGFEVETKTAEQLVDDIVGAASRISNVSDGNRKVRSTAAVALRHTLYQIQTLLQQEQDFFGFFFWGLSHESLTSPGAISQLNISVGDTNGKGGSGSNKNHKKAVKFLGMLGRSESRISDEAVGEHSHDRRRSSGSKLEKLMPEAMLTPTQRERNNILKRIFVEDCKIFKEIDDRIVKYIRGSSNNFEMLSMVVDVDEFTENIGNDASRSFIVESLQTTLQYNARAAFNDFIEEQQRYIDHLKADSRYAGILAPFKKFPAFLDRIITIWRVCSKGTQKFSSFRSDDSGASTNILDGNVQKLVDTLFAWLDRVAESKPKYTRIVLSENLYYFYRTISARKVDFLDSSVRKAYSRFQTIADEYVIMSIEQHFKGFREFVDDVGMLLKRTTHADVKFDKPRDELRRIINKVSKQNIVTNIGQLKDRIKKHFKFESQVRPLIAEKLVNFFCVKYSALEMIARQCYDEKVPLTTEEVRNWLENEFSDFTLPVL